MVDGGVTEKWSFVVIIISQPIFKMDRPLYEKKDRHNRNSVYELFFNRMLESNMSSHTPVINLCTKTSRIPKNRWFILSMSNGPNWLCHPVYKLHKTYRQGSTCQIFTFLLITCSCSFFFCNASNPILAFFKRASQRPAHTQSFRKLHILQLR